MRRGPRQRVRHPDGLLHAAVVRERRLHRRFGGSTAARSSTARSSSGSSGTAASTAGPTASGTRCSRASSVRPPSASRPAASCGGPYTTLPTSPVTREAPYLYSDDSAATTTSSSLSAARLRRATTWSGGQTPGTSIPIDEVLRRQRRRTARRRSTRRLRTGRNLILTPGIYQLDQTISVTRPDTVVLGLGFPTLVPDERDRRR